MTFSNGINWQKRTCLHVRERIFASGETDLVWRSPGGDLAVSRAWSAGTTVAPPWLTTTMRRQGDEFLASLRAPRGAEIEYRFRTTMTRRGNAIRPLWDSSQAYRRLGWTGTQRWSSARQ